MHNSFENKEVKRRDNLRSKKESKQSKGKRSSHSGSNSVNSGKSTPKQSKDKVISSNARKSHKEEIIRFNYYSSDNQIKNNFKNDKNSFNAEIDSNCKKSRRNIEDSKNKIKNEIQNDNVYDLDEYQQKVLFQDSVISSNSKLKSPILKKIKQLSIKGSIDFNGQALRKPRISSSGKKTQFGFSIEDYSGYQPQKKAAGSKSKNQSKSKGKSKEKKNQVSHKKKKIDPKKEQKNNKGLESNKKPKYENEVSESYRIQAYENSLRPLGKNEMIELQEEVQKDLENAYEYILTQELIKERGQCLNMLGKICSSMNLKRESYSISLSYIDSFIDMNTELKLIKTITIAALMMALKIDNTEMSGTAMHYSTVSSMQSFSDNKGQSISTEARSLDKKGKRIDSESKSRPENQSKFNMNRPKLPNMLTMVLSHEQIFSEYDRILCKEQIMDMEMQMMIKLNFKLTIRSYTYWAESLTTLWDTFILQSYSKLRCKVSFRSQENFKNLSFLYQLIEVSYYFPYAYFYPKVILILSIMYLLIRIRIEQGFEKEEKGFDHFRSNLGKSTNLIFVDKLGTNELFGEFLSMINLDMGDIVSCCQYVSHYFQYKIVKAFSQLLDKSRSNPEDVNIYAYQYNPEIYRFFQNKSGGVLHSEMSDKSEFY